MQFIRQNSWILFWSTCYLVIAAYLMWNKQEFLTLFPVGLIALLERLDSEGRNNRSPELLSTVQQILLVRST